MMTMSSLEVLQDVPLKPYTTFKIGGPARYFCSVIGPEEAREAAALARSQSLPIFVLGGGSNILVSDAGFSGVVVHPARDGIESLGQPSNDRGGTSVRLRAGAGEPWDQLVGLTVDEGWWGIENLSHIPGQSGAALVQNIGAYGQQLSDVFEKAEALGLGSGELHALSAAECGLGYRRSIFNSTRRGEFLIWRITLRLSTEPRPQLSYRDVHAYFMERGTSAPGQREIRQAIVEIRDAKFPFPREERGGNAGSFFKNPGLGPDEWRSLGARIQARFGESERDRFADLQQRLGLTGSTAVHPVNVPAAFLIEICGLRGFELGRAQVNPSQPLVIVNQGGATADDVLRLAGHVRRKVRRETGVALELEPELVGFSPQEVQGYLGLN
jgi:UDP-N-acetylmuramate dehydrogenase